MDLTNRTRLMSLEQIAREYMPFSEQSREEYAMKVIKWLEKDGLLHTKKAVVHPLISLEAGPVLSWDPGDGFPNFSRLSYRLQSRWRLSPRTTLVCRATKLARRHTNGTVGGRRTRATELRHDLMVSELLFKVKRDSPHLLSTWVHEDTLISQNQHSSGLAIPDCLIDDVPNDFGGAYSAAKLLRMHHAFCHDKYVIW